MVSCSLVQMASFNKERYSRKGGGKDKGKQDKGVKGNPKDSGKGKKGKSKSWPDAWAFKDPKGKSFPVKRFPRKPLVRKLYCY